MAYTAWSVVFGEQPTAAKWNQLGENDAGFRDGTNFALNDKVIPANSVANGIIVQRVHQGYSAYAGSTTTMNVLVDAAPPNTEGFEIMTLAITPKASSNKLIIRAHAYLSSTLANNNMGIVLFKDSGANAIAGTGNRTSATANTARSCYLEHEIDAGSTSAQTFKVRAGANGAGTTGFNGQSASRVMGAIPKSSITIEEVRA